MATGAWGRDIFSILDFEGLEPLRPVGATPEPTCRICYDEHSTDNMVNIPDCQHKFCRHCLLFHVRSKVEDMLYPILCPLCAVDPLIPVGNKAQIDQRVLDQIKDDLLDGEYEKFETLQLTMHAMAIQCPDCKHEMKVAREDLDRVLVKCPVPTCGSNWCRACQKVLPKCREWHRCKSDRKLRRLMRAKKWRYCPGCRTPIQRTEGCSHMTCGAPGCRTHFCYRCGNTIWQPGQRGDPYDAASFHNKWCRVVFIMGCPIQ